MPAGLGGISKDHGVIVAKPKFKISTDDSSSEEALSFWERHLREIGLGGTIIPQANEGFFASAVAYEFGKSTLYFHKRASSKYERNNIRCVHDSSDVFFLTYVKKGEAFYEQGGRDTTVQSEDCFLMYTGEPFRCFRFNPSEATTLIFPRSFIQGWVPNPCDITAVPFLRHSRWGKALSATLAALTPDLDALAVTPDAIVDQINCLLALAAGPSTFVLPSTYKRGLLRRFRQALQSHYNDPDFSPVMLAKEQGISTRTLYSTFASANTSFRKELLSFRIKKARWYLDDPRFDKKEIAEIAAFVGYAHASHFITHFHQAHGVTPAAYRKMRKT
jgi:AraC-like DNA-binding protein